MAKRMTYSKSCGHRDLNSRSTLKQEGVPGCGLSSPACYGMQSVEGQCPNQTRRWPQYQQI